MRVNRVTGDIESNKISISVAPEEFRAAVASLGGHQDTLAIQGERVLELLTGLEVDGVQWVRHTRDLCSGNVIITMGSRDE